ncbi:unnamed protein product [Choristocarpus tenellus]
MMCCASSRVSRDSYGLAVGRVRVRIGKIICFSALQYCQVHWTCGYKKLFPQVQAWSMSEDKKLVLHQMFLGSMMSLLCMLTLLRAGFCLCSMPIKELLN